MKSKQVIVSTFFSTVCVVFIFSLFNFSNSEPIKGTAFSEMPMGSIIIWAGEDIPVGWEICRGQIKNKLGNSNLYQAIGGYWNEDTGLGTDFFQLPDLRGVFLRGVNGSRNDQYKDESNRKSVTGNSTFDNTVGSFQNDDFESHNHGGGIHKHTTKKHAHGLKVWDKNNVRRDRASAAYIGTTQRGTTVTESTTVVVNNSGTVINYEGANETVPKNAYVHYIIKVL
jgi:microcystin-dependent protein